MDSQQNYSKDVTLKDGTKVYLRPSVKEDYENVWKMFSSLSKESLRFLPIRFTSERVGEWFKEMDYEKVLPILGIVRENGEDRVIADSSLEFSKLESRRHRAELGITVHDDYQGRGLGTEIIRHLIDIAKSKRVKKLELLVVANNERAIHLYEKMGFIKEGHLRMNHYSYITKDYGDDIPMAHFL